MGNSMTSLVINGDTSGSITLQAPAAAGSSVHTLPAATGTVMVSGNMPTFYAYASATGNFSGATVTKVQLNAELFDTANCFDSSTNYRFTPNVAGYYLINCSTALVAAGQSQAVIMVYKNGVMYARWESRATQSYYLSGGTTIVYLNGSTDYIESYVYCGTNSGYYDNGQQYTTMSGMLMRAGAA
jgi:hypothetical protein